MRSLCHPRLEGVKRCVRLGAAVPPTPPAPGPEDAHDRRRWIRRKPWSKWFQEYELDTPHASSLVVSLHVLNEFLNPRGDADPGRILWLSPEVFLASEETTCCLWLTDFGMDTDYDARLSLTVLETNGRAFDPHHCRKTHICHGGSRQSPHHPPQPTDTTDASRRRHRFYLWMPTNQRQQHLSSVLEPMRRPLDTVGSWLALWSLDTIRFQSVRMTVGWPWLPLSPHILQRLLTSVQHMHLRLLRMDAHQSRVLGRTTWSGTLRLDRVCLDDPHGFVQELTRHTDAGPTELVIQRPANGWSDTIWQLLAQKSRLRAVELTDDHHHPMPALPPQNRNLALASNLETLRLSYFTVRLQEWKLLWAALRHHPAMHSVCLGEEHAGILHPSLPDGPHDTHQQRKEQGEIVAQALRINRTIQNLQVSSGQVSPEIWKEQIQPCIERNQFDGRFQELAIAMAPRPLAQGYCCVCGGQLGSSTPDHAGTFQLGLFAKAVGALGARPRLMYQFLERNQASLVDALSQARDNS